MTNKVDVLRPNEGLREAYVLSSTPRQLYRRFTADGTVKLLASSHGADHLLEMARTSASHAGLDGVVWAYACLIAVSLGPDSVQARRVLRSASVDRLDWLEEVRDLCLTSLATPEVLKIDLWAKPDTRAYSIATRPVLLSGTKNEVVVVSRAG